MSDDPRNVAGVMELVEQGQVIDLAYTLTPDFPLYPVYDPPKVAEKFTIEQIDVIRSKLPG